MNWPIWKNLAYVASLALCLAAIVGGRNTSFCQIWKRDIQKADLSTKDSRNYQGLWVSSKCEVLPGPKFLLRRYDFLRNGHFHLIRYYYLDPWCTVAAFSVIAVGRFETAPERAPPSSCSWIVPGGLELDYVLRRIVVIPITLEGAKLLTRQANRSCPWLMRTPWRPLRKYKLSYEEMPSSFKKVSNYRSAYEVLRRSSCVEALGLNFNELQLTRLEVRTPSTFFRPKGGLTQTGNDVESFLFLGATGENQTEFRPTYYQVPLLRTEAVSCPVCLLLSKTTATSPPLLPASEDAPIANYDFLDGEFTSLRCEVRPYGLFLKRHFSFKNTAKRWKGFHAYYKDPKCLKPMFELKASGIYVPGVPSSTIHGSIEYDFEILDVDIVPNDELFLQNLRGLDDCGTGRFWQIGQAINLTATGGCSGLGIAVPSKELDLIKFDYELPGIKFLYLGETSGNKSRPTSFQPPLVQCSPIYEFGDDVNLVNNALHPLPLISKAVMCRNIHVFYLCIFIDFLYAIFQILRA